MIIINQNYKGINQLFLSKDILNPSLNFCFAYWSIWANLFSVREFILLSHPPTIIFYKSLKLDNKNEAI